jgi:hypothetical protein
VTALLAIGEVRAQRQPSDSGERLGDGHIRGASQLEPAPCEITMQLRIACSISGLVQNPCTRGVRTSRSGAMLR